MMLSVCSHAQDSLPTSSSTFTLSGYAEAYYSYDLNRPPDNLRPGFLYNYNRHNEFTLNLGYLKGIYTGESVRANLALAAGTYMNANYAAEPATLKNVLEANAGYKLSRKKNLWLDIGILPSHIGFETAIGKDNWTLTRSLVAENSPYFESGARLGYTTGNGKLQLSVLALNGWQRITRAEGNSLMSWGAQVYYKLSNNIILNYSNFFGTDKPDSARLWRYYHDVYGIFQLSPVVGLTAGFDVGMEQQNVNSHQYNYWYTPVGILRITPADKWAFALRGEYFNDQHGVIIASAGGFKTFGASFNIDYYPVKNALLRLEYRYLNSANPVFIKDGLPRDNNTAISFSTSIAF